MTLQLLHGPSVQHTGGLEALALSGDGDRLYTASRDATVRSWDVAGNNSGRCAAVYMGHSNWVNDLVLLDDLLISCSSDYSISMWNTNARGRFVIIRSTTFLQFGEGSPDSRS